MPVFPSLLRAEWDDVHDHERRRLLLLHEAPEAEGRMDHVGSAGGLIFNEKEPHLIRFLYFFASFLKL